MHVQLEFSENASFAANVAPAADPRLQPTPDDATPGPASDVPSARTTCTLDAKDRIRVARLLALAVGMSGALWVGSLRTMSPPLARAARVHIPPHDFASDAGNIDHLQPQMQAEKLLQLAVGNSGDAVDQISSRVGRWRGNLVWNSQMASLTTAALNSNDLRVRESGIEVELAAYGLSKNSACLEYLLKTVKSRDHTQKIWALWALGLMANRGVAPERALAALTAQLHDSDVDSRRWSVDALSLIGADSTIPVLLGVMHDDASPIVRREAACAIAQSGMFTPEQRMSAVPQLLDYSDDPSLDAQTHAWAFQVLGDISGQHLPDDPAAWRNWYENRN
jgi:HEAT repeats